MGTWKDQEHPAPPKIIDVFDTDLIHISPTQTEVGMISFYDEMSRQAVSSWHLDSYTINPHP